MTDSSMPDWVTSSDTTHTYQSRGIRVGRLLAPAPQIEPDRWSHAVVPGTEVTLCGMSTDGLHNFSGKVFRHVNQNLRCKECNELAGYPESRS
jgi:hypothetical protein